MRPRGIPARIWLAIVAGLLLLTIAANTIQVIRQVARPDGDLHDAGVYMRAGWAIAAGENPYLVASAKGWHYHYAPLLAILFVPLADPPSGAGPLPGWVAFAVWDVIGIILLFAAIEMPARAVERRWREEARADMRPFDEGWWELRLLPLVACSLSVVATLATGQANMLVLVGVCGMAAALIGRRPWQAGLWLSLAICVKPFAGVLLAYPALRRQGRCVAGCAVGLLAGLLLVPVVALGPARGLSLLRDWWSLRLAGLLAGHLDPAIADELNPLRGNYPSFAAIMFRTLHPRAATWPAEIPPGYLLAGQTLGLVLLGVTILLLARWHLRREPRGVDNLLALGSLMAVALPLQPTLKAHYYVLLLPLAMGLAGDWLERSAAPRRAGLGLLIAVAFAMGAGMLYLVVRFLGQPELAFGLGLETWAALLLWAAGLGALARRSAGHGTRVLIQC
jgi:hypothetical protein